MSETTIAQPDPKPPRKRRRPLSAEDPENRFSRWLFKEGFTSRTFARSFLPIPLHWVTVNRWRQSRKELRRMCPFWRLTIKGKYPKCPL